MRFLFISRRGAGLSLAKKVADEGHIVKFYIHNANYRQLGNGIIEKAQASEFKDCDVVIFDEAGLGDYATDIAKHKPVLGASKFADTFNNNRDYKEEVLNRCNMTCESYPDPKRMNLQDEWEKITIYTTGWYNGFNFISPFHSYFKKTKFMEGDLSIDTECMGCLLWYHKTNKLVKNTLHKLRGELKKIGYKGAITFRCQVNSKNIQIDDVHFGFEYDSTYAALEGLRQPISETLYRMAFDSIKRVKASPDWLCATRVTRPPYPFPMLNEYKSGGGIIGINNENLRHIWLRDVYKDDNIGVYFPAGSDGFILTVTARGLTPYKAFKRTHRTIGNLSIYDIQFRIDVVYGMEEKYNKIHDWGWV